MTKKYSTKSDIGKLKNARDEIIQLKRKCSKLKTVLKQTIKRKDKLIMEMVAEARVAREKYERATGKSFKSIRSK